MIQEDSPVVLSPRTMLKYIKVSEPPGNNITPCLMLWIGERENRIAYWLSPPSPPTKQAPILSP